jgi:hypothetical protein
LLERAGLNAVAVAQVFEDVLCGLGFAGTWKIIITILDLQFHYFQKK